MPSFTNINGLIKYVEKQAQDVMKEDVKNTVVKTIQDHVKSDVYEEYEQSTYIRTGGLLRDIDDKFEDNELTVSSVRYSYQGGKKKYVSEIVEYGVGYTVFEDGKWKPIRPRADHPWAITGWQPRPFMEKAYEDLRDSKKHIESFKKGMKKRGINLV